MTFCEPVMVRRRSPRAIERQIGGSHPPAVRILPMSSSEPGFRSKNFEKIQRSFFLQRLPAPPKPGRWLFRKAGLHACRGTVVLFQYEARIIASATLDRVERFDRSESGCSGALYFDVGSIRVFDPVSASQIKSIWPAFTGFSHAKHNLNPARYAAFERQLTGIKRPTQLNSRVPPASWDCQYRTARRCADMEHLA